MDVRSETRRIGRVNEVRGTERTTDVKRITVYYGVEQIGDTEYVVTPEASTARGVQEPTEAEKGRRIGPEVIRERLRILRDQRAALISPDNDGEIAAIDTEATRLRGMLG